jgi:endoribonuclease Dicer
MLLVTELNASLFDHSIQEHHLHAAISAPSACAELDYERLELLGDAYLKYLSSIYLFVTNPAQHEGALHSARLRIISNKALFLNAESVGLAPYIQAKPLAPRQWNPPNFTVIPPPPAKTSTAECATTVNEDGTVSEMILDALGYEREKKEHDRSSPGLQYPGVGDLGSHSVTVDSLKSSDCVVHEGMVVERTPLDGNIDEGATPDGVSKPTVGQPPLKKSKKDDQNVQWLGEKVNVPAISARWLVHGLQAIADVVEAIIGAAYVTGGSETALNASKALRIAVPSIDQWSDFGRKALAPPPGVTTPLRPGTVEAIEEIMGHKFHRPHILAQALVRRNFPYFRNRRAKRTCVDACLDTGF